MMKPDFLRFVAGLCEFYQEEKWPTQENLDAAFRDVKGLPESALEAVGSNIRTTWHKFPASLSAAMHRAYKAVESELARAKAEKDKKKQKPWVPPTPQERATAVSRCGDILAMLNGKRVPPSWLEQARRGG